MTVTHNALLRGVAVCVVAIGVFLVDVPKDQGRGGLA
jgi:hypothetical protein